MEKPPKKSKRRRNSSSSEKEKSFFPPDLKSIKDNIKKEFLRTVKINNSFRVKGPRSTKVMLDIMDDKESGYDTLEATNNEVIDSYSEVKSLTDSTDECDPSNNKTETISEVDTSPETNTCDTQVVNTCHSHGEKEESVEDTVPSHDQTSSENDLYVINESDKNVEVAVEQLVKDNCEHSEIQTHHLNNVTEHIEKDHATALPNIGSSLYADRNRKYSLDNNVLLRRPSWSQSEIDLHSVGKLPLERKSSFFRKKLDKFFKNTSEIFKRQSSIKSEDIKRRGSISCSMQSLNNPAIYESDLQDNKQEDPLDGLKKEKTYSECSLAESQGSRPSQGTSRISLVSSQPSLGDTHLSQPLLYTSQPLVDGASGSTNSLTDGYQEDPLLNSRAISFSSGLDNVEESKRRKAKRANRVTWLASDSVAEYMRKIVEDRREVDIPRSYSDTCSAQKWNSMSLSRSDSKGRRLSYQRAVSGEDPVKYQDRKKNKTDQNEVPELRRLLNVFTQNGLPELEGYSLPDIPSKSLAYIEAISVDNTYLNQFYVGEPLSPSEVHYEEAVKELITTEANYIKHMLTILNLFVAVAHKIQYHGLMLDLDTSKLFLNVPDIVNANLIFWDAAICPMIEKAKQEHSKFSAENLYMGFYQFRRLFEPYNEYLCNQRKAIDYLKAMCVNKEFAIYITWCHNHKECRRLQIHDLLVKPLQRVTKYSLLLNRIIGKATNAEEIATLNVMETLARKSVYNMNRAVRNKEENKKLENVIEALDPYLLEFKDPYMNAQFRQLSKLNLKSPIAGCLPFLKRAVIYEGFMRYKDFYKDDCDVRLILLTDVLLVCKKNSSKSMRPYRVARQKYLVSQMHVHPLDRFVPNKGNKEYDRIVITVVDDVNTAYHCFTLWDPTQKDESPTKIEIWNQKFLEARINLDIMYYFDEIPYQSHDDIEEFFDQYFMKGIQPSPIDANVEREIRERVLAMLYDPSFDTPAQSFIEFFYANFNSDANEIRRENIQKIIRLRGISKSNIQRLYWKSVQPSSSQANDMPPQQLHHVNYLHQLLQYQLDETNHKLYQKFDIQKKFQEDLENEVKQHQLLQNTEMSAGDIDIDAVLEEPKSSVSLPQKIPEMPSYPGSAQYYMPDKTDTRSPSREEVAAEIPKLHLSDVDMPNQISPLPLDLPSGPSESMDHTASLQLPKSLRLPETPTRPQSPKSPQLCPSNFSLSPKSPSSPRSPKIPLRGIVATLDDDCEDVLVTIQMASESESDTLVSKQSVSPRSPSLAPSNGNRLHLPSNVAIPKPPSSEDPRLQSNTFSFPSASELLYHSHEILIEKYKIMYQSQSPHLLSSGDTRSTSYTPSSTRYANASASRGTLKRELAFSSSFKHPLMKMSNVSSQHSQATDALSISRQASPRSDRGYSPISYRSSSSIGCLSVGNTHGSDMALPGPSHSLGTEISASGTISISGSAVSADKSSSSSAARNKNGQGQFKNHVNNGKQNKERSKDKYKENDEMENMYVQTKDDNNSAFIAGETSEEKLNITIIEKNGGDTSRDISIRVVSDASNENNDTSADQADEKKGIRRNPTPHCKDKYSLIVKEKDDDKSSSKSNGKDSEDKSSKKSLIGVGNNIGCFFGFLRRQKKSDSSDSSSNGKITQDKSKIMSKSKSGSFLRFKNSRREIVSGKGNGESSSTSSNLEQIIKKKNDYTKSTKKIVRSEIHDIPKSLKLHEKKDQTLDSSYISNSASKNDQIITDIVLGVDKELQITADTKKEKIKININLGKIPPSTENENAEKILEEHKDLIEKCSMNKLKEVDRKNSDVLGVNEEADGRQSTTSSERRRLHKAQDSIRTLRKRKKRSE